MHHENKFKNLLSLIPSAYTSNFNDVQADGDFLFNGFVKGTYDLTGKNYPAFQLNLNINNADFKYPNLPMGVKNIAGKAKVNFPGGTNFDKLVVDVSGFEMLLGNNPFKANLLLKTPVSDPDIKTKINGILDLADVAKAFPMEAVQKLNGRITADINADTRMSNIDRQDYENVNMSGQLQVESLNYESTGLPAVNIRSMEMDFTPKNVLVQDFNAKLGSSDVIATGSIDNILAYFSPEKTMTGKLTINSNYFNANEWIPETDPNAINPEGPTEPVEIFDRFKFDIMAKSPQDGL